MTVPLTFLFIKQELHKGNFYSVFSIILAFETVWDKIHFAIGWCMNEKLETRVPQSWAKEDGWVPPWQVLCIYSYVQKKIKKKKKAAGGVGMNWPPGILYGKQAAKYTH